MTLLCGEMQFIKVIRHTEIKMTKILRKNPAKSVDFTSYIEYDRNNLKFNGCYRFKMRIGFDADSRKEIH